MKYIVLLGRILYSLIFVMSGLMGHFISYAQTAGYAATKGVPGFLVIVTGVMMLLGGLSILLGYKARWGAWLIVAFLVPTTFIMHGFWSIPDPMMRGMQMAMFMKNLSMLGAALIITQLGSGPLSLDAKGAGAGAQGAAAA